MNRATRVWYGVVYRIVVLSKGGLQPADVCNQLNLRDELAERLLVEFQDASKVTHYYLNDLGGKYSMSKTTPKENEQGYGIRANNDPSEQNFAIFRYALSHIFNASVYVAAAEAQSRGNNDWGLGV